MTRTQLITLVVAMAAAGAAPAYLTWRAHTTMPKDLPRESRRFPVTRTDEQWQASLTPKQYAVLRGHDTEYPGTSPLLDEHRDGVFACAGCGQPLFSSETKYDAGCGWPSFTDALDPEKITRKEDRSHGMLRVETVCANCGAHLGHVFPDGPGPSGDRFCMNSASLDHTPAD